MAIGFTPRYSEIFTQEQLQSHQFLMLALRTAQDLEWDVQYLSNTGLIAYTNNGMLKFNAEFKIILDGNHGTLISSSTGNEYFDLGKNKKTVKCFISRFGELKETIPAEELDESYEQIRERLIPGSQDLLRLPDPTGLDIFKDFLSVFKPSDNYFFTPILLNINILMFIIMALNGVHLMTPTGDSLILWGANYKPLTLAGEWWRLLSCCFIHIGMPHLLMNMYALLYIGLMIEPILGKSRFITAYLSTGVIASLTSLWWHDISISAGASGAIFGMYGVFLALLTTSVVEKSTRRPLFISIAIFVVYNLMSGIKEGVDNAAHIGGLLSGIIFAFVFLPGLKKGGSAVLKNASLVFIIVMTLALGFFAIKQIPDNIGKYDAYMTLMYSNDTTALSVYRIADSLPKDEKLLKIKEVAIGKTIENLTLMSELEHTKLPVHLQYRTGLFKKYFQIRLSSYEVYYRSMDEETSKYDSTLDGYYAQIDSLNKIISSND